MGRRIPTTIFIGVVLIASTFFSPQTHAATLAGIRTTGASLWQQYTVAVNRSLFSATAFIQQLLASPDLHKTTAAVGQSNINTQPISPLSSAPSSNQTPQSFTSSSNIPTIVNNYYTLASSSPAIMVSPVGGVGEAELTQKLAERDAALEAQIISRSNVYSDTSTKTYGLSFSNLTVSGVTGLTDADIPDDITASNYLPLTGGTISGDLTIIGAFSGGTLSLLSATTTSLFATTASFSSLSIGATATSTFGTDGALTLAGLGTWRSGFLSQASSTIVGNFTTTGTNTFTGDLLVTGNTTLTNAITSSVFIKSALTASNAIIGALTATSSLAVYGSASASSAAFGATATSSFSTAGALTLASALTVPNGGTGTTTWQTGSIPFFDGTNLTEDNSNLFWDGINHRLGIGTTSPQSLVQINPIGTTTNANADGVLLRVDGLVDGARGIVLTPKMTGTNTSPGAITLAAELRPAVNLGIAFGNILNATIDGSSGNGGITSLHSNYMRLSTKGNYSGTISTAESLYIESPSLGVSVPATMYGLLIQNQGKAGGTTSYGLYVANQSGAANSYAAIFAGGNVGIGTTTPDGKLTILGSSNIAGVGSINLTNGIGQAAALRLDTTNLDLNFDREFGGVWSTSMTVQRSSGNVGIGTTTPNGFLTVYNTALPPGGGGAEPTNVGTIRIMDTGGYSANGGGGLEFKTSISGSGYGWKISAPDLGSENVPLVFNFRKNSATWSEAMRINNSGNVGIGTTSPGSILSVRGVANWTTATSTYYSTGGVNLAAGCFAISGTCLGLGNLSGTLAVNQGGTGASAFGQGWLYSNGGAGALAASTSPTVNYLTATSTTVASQFPYASSTAITASGTGFFGNAALTLGSGTTTIAAGQGFTIGGTQFMLQQGIGNVSIGGASAISNRKLDVNGIVGVTGLKISAGFDFAHVGTFAFDDVTGNLDYTSMGGSQQNLTFNPVGNVGIGTSAPGALLQVGGTQANINPSLSATNLGTFSIRSSNNFISFGSQIAAPFTSWIQAHDFASNPIPLALDPSGGNVGIGTTSPGSILSVQGVANWTTATSTYYSTGGINLAAGCFAISGTCLTSLSSLTATAPLTFAGNTLSISQANGSTNGYLSSEDWTTFNNKVSSSSLLTSIANAYDFSLAGNATSTLTQFNGGFTAYASSTIGNGALGLTINGNATTTGQSYFANAVRIGSATGGAYTLGVLGSFGTGPLSIMGSGLGSVNKGTFTFTDATGNLNYTSTGGTQGNLTFSPLGNVGIGTTTPQTKLVIDGTTGDAASGVRIQDDNFSGALGGVDLYQDNAGAFNIYNNALNSGGGINLATGGSSRLSVLRNGNVGIGTTTPTAHLDIFDASKNLGTTPTEANSILAVMNGTSGIGFDSNQIESIGAGNALFINHGSTNNIIFDGGGNVGIGATVPDAMLDISTAGTPAAGQMIGFEVEGTQSAAGLDPYYGGYINPFYAAPSGNTLNVFTGLKLTPQNTGTGRVANLRGIETSPKNVSTGTVGTIYGIDADPASAGGGAVGAVVGLNSLPAKSGMGAVTSLLGLYTQCANSTTGAVTNCYGAYLDSPFITGGGTITNRYGVYQTDTAAINYFAGNVGVGTTSPTYQLSIQGMTNSTPGTLALASNQGGVANGEVGRLVFNNNTQADIAQISGFRTGANTGGTLTFSTANSGTLAERLRIDSSGNVGIGTTTPQFLLSVGGNAQVGGNNTDGRLYALSADSKIRSELFSFNGLGGYVGTFTNNKFTIRTNDTDRMTFDTSGNVGIGTTTPNSNLTVYSPSAYGSIFEAGDLFVNQKYSFIASSTLGTLVFDSSGETASTGKPIYFTEGGGSPLLSILSNGNVGINTASPSAFLQINNGTPSSSRSGTMAVFGTVTGCTSCTSAISITAGPTGFAALDFGAVGGTSFNGAITYDNSSHTMGFSTLFNQPMVITSAGNVGIGTTSPVSLLSVSGSDAGTNLAAGSAIASSITNTDTTAGNFAALDFYGIQTSASIARLSGRIATVFDHTGSVSGGMAFITRNAGTLSEKMRITSAGNVGIGTTSPDMLLSVGNNTPVGAVAHFENSTGSCYINPTSTSLSCSSDARLKKNITELNASTTLADLMQLTAVTYNWNTEATGTDPHTGFIAQQVLPVLPDLVSKGPDGFYSLNYAGFTPYLVKAIQEIVSISGIFRSNLIAFLGDASNGINDFFAKNIYGSNIYVQNKLCIADGPDDPAPVCVTKSQLAALLSGTAQPAPGQGSGSQSSTPGQGGAGPTITLLGDNPVRVSVGDIYDDPSVRVMGPADPAHPYQTFINGLAANISSSTISTAVPATYTITYKAIDEAGNTTTATRTVIVGVPAISSNTGTPGESAAPTNSTTTTMPTTAPAATSTTAASGNDQAATTPPAVTTTPDTATPAATADTNATPPLPDQTQSPPSAQVASPAPAASAPDTDNAAANGPAGDTPAP